ncbi:uncharacterized protein PV07_08764 [Cladophialophora immunda]|uniref:Uncharacterized protein n=1 Tax=Cladophialophora immunda TaxID=569365 RepID=A0A0D2C325_9EURO|nr:uncharacterized protein PV07_08764 [Cladophialophora immunda]KIW25598.1 hypothetical protein PV07_08764 [Cladophialophora immunda]OQV07701.1 hypothetical protein CLAIMM_12100 [Cladophialophora immunda]
MATSNPDQAQHYDVLCVESAGLTAQNHVAIFVETHELGPGTGHIYQVSGSIQLGMFHSYRPGKKPEEDEQSVFVSKRVLGRVSKAVYDDGTFRRVCDSVAPPPKQFNGPKRLFPGTKLIRCGEWAQEALEKLKLEGILV